MSGIAGKSAQSEQIKHPLEKTCTESNFTLMSLPPTFHPLQVVDCALLSYVPLSFFPIPSDRAIAVETNQPDLE